MTMDSMVRHLESSGFETTKQYDTAQGGYWFRISKDDFHAEKFFKYPADVSPTQRDCQQRDFIDSIIDLWHRSFKESRQKQEASAKKMILVGQPGRNAAFNFMNAVIESLNSRSVDITYIDHRGIRFRTRHTEVLFVSPIADRIKNIEGIRADAIFGVPFTELLARASNDAVIGYRDGIGLVDYICQVEREISESRKALEVGEAFHEGLLAGMRAEPKKIYISTASPNNPFWKSMMNSVYGKFPDQQVAFALGSRSGKTQACLKYLEKAFWKNVEKEIVYGGENTMPTREERNYIHQDVESLMSAIMRNANTPKPKLPGIKTVHFSGPVTAVIWEDKTKTIVRCKDGEEPDYEKGLAMAIAKKALGTNKSGSNYYDIFKKWLPKPEAEEEPVKEVKQDG